MTLDDFVNAEGLLCKMSRNFLLENLTNSVLTGAQIKKTGT